MSTLAEECLNQRTVITNLNKYANTLSHHLPTSMDFNDARQELVTGLIERLPRYKPSKGRMDVFAVYVIRTLTWNMIKTRRFYTHEQKVPLLEEMLIDLTESRLEGRVIDKLLCNEIEKLLDGKAKQIFSYLRVGMSQTDCAELMGISRQLVYEIFRKKVRKTVYKSKCF